MTDNADTAANYELRRMLQVVTDRLEMANTYKGDETSEWESKTTDLFWVDQAKILLYGRIPAGHARSQEKAPEPRSGPILVPVWTQKDGEKPSFLRLSAKPKGKRRPPKIPERTTHVRHQ